MEQLLNRIKQILLNPKEAWEEISKEQTPMAKVLVNYVLPLSLIGAIASFIGWGLIGFFGFAVAEWGIKMAFIHLITVFGGVILSGWVISILAPSFECKVSLDDGVKLVAYAYTPLLLASIFMIFPRIYFLAPIAGLFGLYLLYTWFKPATKVAEDKLTGYLLVSVIAMGASYFLLNLLLKAILPIGFAAANFRGWGF